MKAPFAKAWTCSKTVSIGEVAEWLMAPVLKTGIPERVSGVRIPPSPPYILECRETWLHFPPEKSSKLPISFAVRSDRHARAVLFQRLRFACDAIAG
jgi:hypothetical protein